MYKKCTNACITDISINVSLLGPTLVKGFGFPPNLEDIPATKNTNIVIFKIEESF